MAVELAGNVYPIVVNARRNKETLGPFASPSALAVLRLTASSNLTGCSNGRSHCWDYRRVASYALNGNGQPKCFSRKLRLPTSQASQHGRNGRMLPGENRRAINAEVVLENRRM
jgi:hypothetical protein